MKLAFILMNIFGTFLLISGCFQSSQMSLKERLESHLVDELNLESISLLEFKDWFDKKAENIQPCELSFEDKDFYKINDSKLNRKDISLKFKNVTLYDVVSIVSNMTSTRFRLEQDKIVFFEAIDFEKSESAQSPTNALTPEKTPGP